MDAYAHYENGMYLKLNKKPISFLTVFVNFNFLLRAQMQSRSTRGTRSKRTEAQKKAAHTHNINILFDDKKNTPFKMAAAIFIAFLITRHKKCTLQIRFSSRNSLEWKFSHLIVKLIAVILRILISEWFDRQMHKVFFHLIDGCLKQNRKKRRRLVKLFFFFFFFCVSFTWFVSQSTSQG